VHRPGYLAHPKEEERTMAKTTVTKALSNYFNTGEGKRSASDFLKELRDLTPAEKLELAQGVVEITGDELSN